MTRKPIYRSKDNWVLGQCNVCGKLNYVEPHGTSAQCKCSQEWTEHSSIPYQYRDMSGCWLIGKPVQSRNLGQHPQVVPDRQA